MSKSEEKFDVTIKGEIIGYRIATLDQVQKIEKDIQKHEKELTKLLKNINEQKERLDLVYSRIERLEKFLASFQSSQ